MVEKLRASAAVAEAAATEALERLTTATAHASELERDLSVKATVHQVCWSYHATWHR
jgi:hypothetical protein